MVWLEDRASRGGRRLGIGNERRLRLRRGSNPELPPDCWVLSHCLDRTFLCWLPGLLSMSCLRWPAHSQQPFASSLSFPTTVHGSLLPWQSPCSGLPVSTPSTWHSLLVLTWLLRKHGSLEKGVWGPKPHAPLSYDCFSYRCLQAGTGSPPDDADGNIPQQPEC